MEISVTRRRAMGRRDRRAWRLAAGLVATAACLAPVAAIAFSLPACPANRAEGWTDCVAIYAFSNGDRYQGEFRDDLPNGQGSYSFANGDQYLGEFRDGAFNGNGVLVFANQSKYVGQFRNGEYDGVGTEYLPNGHKGRSGMWFNSEFIRALDDPVTAPPPGSGAPPAAGQSHEVHLVEDGGTFMVPVKVNNSISLNFTVDSGAADVSIPDAVVARLRRDGSLRDDDFQGPRTYVLADGSKVTSNTFLIRTLRVGDWVVDDVLASNGGASGSLLLGQSFLSRFHSWSIDNGRNVLVLE
jgi:hypothetical protein